VVDHRVPAARAGVRYFVRRCRGEGRSKAALVSLSDHRTALASEREYVRRTLPSGVARGARAGRWAQAAAIGLGVGATAAGYAQHRVRTGLTR
jgi:hypothetical protein